MVEALPTHLEDQLINFCKMRRVSSSVDYHLSRELYTYVMEGFLVKSYTVLEISFAHTYRPHGLPLSLQCTRLILDTLHHQKEPYDMTFEPEISKILLCAPIPGTEDDLYRYVDTISDK